MHISKRHYPMRMLRTAVCSIAILSVNLAPISLAVAQENTTSAATPTTPIEHLIVIVGENRTFDHVFATYQPHSGETVDNLRSKGIVNADGTPGPNFGKAAQRQATVKTAYEIAPKLDAPYSLLPAPNTDGSPSKASDTSPPPFATLAAATAFATATHDGLDPADYKLLTTGASGRPNDTVDTRVKNAMSLPDGPFQLTGDRLPYDSYTASPVHRFYQMWEQTDCSVTHATAANPSGCNNDLFPFVETSIGAGNNGKPIPAKFGDQTTGEGGTSMGFFNMAQGDAPTFKSLADTYTISDNFHQSIEGGTGANHVALGTGLAIYYTDGQGHVATPPQNQIENPNPQPGTNNYYTQDGYSGGTYSNCSDPTQPGVSSVLSYLSSLPSKPASKCAKNSYYLLNNYNPGYYGDGSVNTTTFTIPPSPVHTIGDVLNTRNIPWKYYGAGWNNYVKDPNSELGSIYCNICNPFQYETSIMTSATQRAQHLKDIPDLESDISSGNLPALSIVKPDGVLDGHPASSKLSLFEAFSKRIVNEVKANPGLWKHTAILITFDEGGGYWDSGYIQPLDFFGDGTRIPAIMVSPYSQGGHVSHVYGDHVSILKFVERNWKVGTVSSTSRDNLPNPVTQSSNQYAPVNGPAIGDMMDMFNFNQSPS